MGTSFRRELAAAVWLSMILWGCAAEKPSEQQRTQDQDSRDGRDGSMSKPEPGEPEHDAGAGDPEPSPPEQDPVSERDASAVADASPAAAMDAGHDGGPDPLSLDGGATDLDVWRDAEAGMVRDAAVNGTDEGVECDVAYRAGHGDIHTTHDEANGLRLHLRSHLVYPGPGGPEPLHDPTGICVVVPASSRQRVLDQGGRPADGTGFEPIGVGAEEAFWFLSNNNLGAEQPFWGVSTEGVETVGAAGDIRLEVEQVDGPEGSDLAVYRVVGIEPRFLVSTADPTKTVSGFQRMSMPAGSHDHYLWSFTQPGIYDVTVRAYLETPGGSMAESPPTTYRFLVEP